MESELKFKYHIYDMFGNFFETDMRAEALASLEEGKFVEEVHETTWRTQRGTSGKNIVIYDWRLLKKGE
jgi:hypothetical protein